MNNDILNRTTLFVENLKRSEEFYKKLFNFNTYKTIFVPLENIPFFPIDKKFKTSSAKLSILKGNNLFGMLGLLEITDFYKKKNKHNICNLGIGSTALVFETNNVEHVINQIDNFDGRVVMPLSDARNIGNEKGDFVPVKMFMAFDPDGYFLEVFQRM